MVNHVCYVSDIMLVDNNSRRHNVG